MPRLSSCRRVAAAAGVAATLVLAACSGGSGSGAPTSASTSGGGTPKQVVASFYPLEYAVAKVGGSAVEVVALTEPGVEPHDLELTPQDVASLTPPTLVVYLGGLQPAVDDAVRQQGANAFDVAQEAALDLPSGAGATGSGPDLHFWLDPTRLASVGQAVAERLAQADPAHAADYRANGAAFAAELGTLDAAFSAGLAGCTNRQLVTSHAAFAYLARRYGFTQVPITGINPDEEPSARQLADVAAAVRAAGATTVYSETLVDDKYARAVATSTGATVAVLDPVEGVTASSPGSDYAEIMRANLAALRAGQSCP